MKKSGRKSLFIGIAVLIAMSLCACSTSDTYPSKEVTMIVPFSSGGSTDLLARTLAEPVGDSLDQSVVVSNVSGASGTVGAAQLADEDPDGYNLMFVTSAPITIQPYFMNGLTYTEESFTYICNIASEPSCIAVPADSHYETLEDLLNADTTISAGNTGVGTLHYLFQISLFEQAGTDYKQVAFDGGAKLVTGLLGGNVDCISTVVSEIYDYVDSGDIRILAISTTDRNEMYEEIATVSEYGYDIDMSLDFFVVGPAGLEEDVLSTLTSAFEGAAESETITSYLESSHIAVNYMDGEALEAKVKEDVETYTQIIDSLDSTE
ncbi:MAG: tripartite tricarboxylate transporter substrate binding protein [Lachnospiraceae bacterium]|nr:tripartite tricarboxylate transporter substrate binding protein [Lachnospiraceae bacterium]